MSYKVYASEAYVNEKEAKLNEEIGKRPIAYDPIIKDGVTIDPGKKIGADLIDAEWMATSSTHDLNIVITPETAGSFEVIDDGNGGSATKLSDIAPTLEQLKSGAFTIGTETISFADTTITQEDGFDGYAVNGMLMIVNNDMHLSGNTLEKGMYVLGEINDDFFADLDTNCANIYIPNIAPVVNLLPEKFIPDTIARTEELEKRPIAYEGYKKEPLTIEYDGVVGDKYQCSLSDAAGVVSYVKVSDMSLDIEDLYSRELSFSDSDFFDDMKVTSISDLNSSLGISGIGIFGGNVGFPIVMAVKEPSNNGEYGNVQQSGIYFLHVQHPDKGDIYVTKLHLPSHTTKEIVKMSPDLIDAAWMAKKSSLEVEVNSENISNYLTDEINDLGVMFGFDVVLKLSDYFVSQDEFINGKCITEFGEVTGTEIPLIMGPGTADMGYTVTIKNLWAYQLSDYCLLVADEGASVYVQDMNTTFSVPKGIYLGADSEEELHALGTLKFHCPEVADAIVPLPEKYLPDTVVQAGIKIVEAPLNIEWDGVTDGRDTANLPLVCVKVSDIILTKEELSTGYITASDGSTQIRNPILAENIVELEQVNGIAIVAGGEPNPDGTHLFPLVYIMHTADNTFPSAGIYFVYTTDFYISNLSVPSYYRQTITKKIDPELVDMDWYAGQTETVETSTYLEIDVPKYVEEMELITATVNGSNKELYKISDIIPTREELCVCQLKSNIDGSVSTGVIEELDEYNFPFEVYGLNFFNGLSGNPFLVVVTENKNGVAAGLYVVKTILDFICKIGDDIEYYDGLLTLIFPGVLMPKEVLKPLPEKYIETTSPEDIMEWMASENIINPVASASGALYTINNKILTI